MSRLDLTSLETYAESCRRIADEDFAGMSVAEAAVREEEYNAYPGLDRLRPPRDLLILDGTLVIAADSIGGIGPKPADTVRAGRGLIMETTREPHPLGAVPCRIR